MEIRTIALTSLQALSDPVKVVLTMEDDIIVRVEAQPGDAHRAIETMLADVDLETAERIVARMSADSTVALSFAFALAVEAAHGVTVPERARAIRGVMAEMERLANHMRGIGAICRESRFPRIHAECGILRERLLAAADAVFAHRLMMDEIIPGGVAQDLSAAAVKVILGALDGVEPSFAKVASACESAASRHRVRGVGRLPTDIAARAGAGGPVGRASGNDVDVRRDRAYPPYDRVTVAVPVLGAGDVEARLRVRIAEVKESIRLLRLWLNGLPSGPVLADFPKAVEPCEGSAAVETYRGDVLVSLRFDAAGRIEQAWISDPSSSQWPLLEHALTGSPIGDLALCLQSFNLSPVGLDL